jgi:formate dehydrogenase iron-sulfur subunit
MSVSFAILNDVTRCTGCERCVKACKVENDLGEDRPWRGQRTIDDLSATRFTTIVRKPGDHNVRRQCRHCLEPACVSACIVGALQKTPEGPVVYDSTRCMGCRYCLMACPFDIPRYEWDRAVPYVRKCNLCYERIRDGDVPACVEACPEQATIFGTRDEMLQEAHRRLEADPSTYVQTVYGEHDVGGTAVLYISSIPLGFLGWQEEYGARPLPDLTWASLKKVPGLALGVGGAMAAIYWFVGRRMKIASQQAAAGDVGSAADMPAETSSKDEDIRD